MTLCRHPPHSNLRSRRPRLISASVSPTPRASPHPRPSWTFPPPEPPSVRLRERARKPSPSPTTPLCQSGSTSRAFFPSPQFREPTPTIFALQPSQTPQAFRRVQPLCFLAQPVASPSISFLLRPARAARIWPSTILLQIQ